MAPPSLEFHASQLPHQVQQDVHGRRRKLEEGVSKIELEGCELLQIVQYNCDVEHPLTPQSMVQCFPVQRLFRRCKDRKGSFVVETTAWEGKQELSQTTKGLSGSDNSNI